MVTATGVPICPLCDAVLTVTDFEHVRECPKCGMEQRYRASIEAFTPLSKLDVVEPEEAEKEEEVDEES